MPSAADAVLDIVPVAVATRVATMALPKKKKGKCKGFFK